jgi:hypothetical protein
MEEGFDVFEYSWNSPAPKQIKSTLAPPLEKRLEKYKNRMELTRTVIGVIVLAIQIAIVYHLLTH